MTRLDVIQITALTAVAVNAILTLVVLTRDCRSKLHQIYLAWGIAATLWNLGVYNLSRDIGPREAFVWAKVLQLGVIFIPAIIFHLCVIIAQVRAGWVAPALYLVVTGFAASLFFNKFITGVHLLPVGYWSVPGPGFYAFSFVYAAVGVFLLVFLYGKQRGAPAMQRKRLRAMLAACVGLAVFGTNDLMPIMGHDTYPLTHVKFFPLGSFAAIFYVLIIGYSVLQHRLLDIHVVLSRLAAQMVRLSFMMLVGFLFLLAVSEFVPGLFTKYSFVAALLILLASALVASFFFPQFFGKDSDDKLERHILGDRFEYHAQVRNLIQTMRSFPDPQFLMQELEDLLAGTMRMRSYQIILLDDTTRGFKVFHCHPPRPEPPAADLQVDSPVFRYFQQTRAKWLACSVIADTAHSMLMKREARAQLKPFEAAFCFPFMVGNDLIGLMLLGQKSSDEMFTPHDLRLLGDLSSSLGLVLNQIRLRQQLQVVHEQDLLGRMSRGLAHDLNNLLTPVQTLLQLCSESHLNQETIDQLLPMSLRNLETVRSYVNEALFFSRSAKLHGQPGFIDQMAREAIALVQPSADAKCVRVAFAGPSDVAMEMDGVLIKRLLCNLLSNAIDASRPGSDVEVRLSPLPKTEPNREWRRLRVIDRGEGISAENLQRVFTPYFTTKNTGDGKRGFGLGLAIARKIVHLHGGNLSITSKESEGTTVQIDLPSRLSGQSSPAPPGGPRPNMVPA
ncbi:MAG TPA: ATP-binding protein [Verrucomicrobiae bacterium]|jgi:signal transduction histidine kinase